MSYYDRQGNPMELLNWARAFDAADRVVKQDDIMGIHVSTVFLGLDHNFEASGPPLIFETMIFGGDHDEYQWRYSTEEQALAGHDQAVALVRAEVAGEVTDDV